MTQEGILKLLETDARLSDEQIAARLGVAVEDVKAERAALEQDGKIVGYQAIVNDDTEGVAAFIEVRCTPERGGGFDRLAQRIARFREVRSCYLISGSFDLLVMVEGATLYDVARFVSEKLAGLDGVLSTATQFKLKTYKHNGLLFEEEHTHERLSVAP